MNRGGKTQRMLIAKARIEALEEAAAIARRRLPNSAGFTPYEVLMRSKFAWEGDAATGEAIARAIEKLARETKL